MPAKIRDLEGFCLLHLLIVAFLALSACTSLETSSDAHQSGANPLEEIERRILTTSHQCYVAKDASSLYALKREMLTWDVDPEQWAAQVYWLAFADFNLAQLEEIFGSTDQSLLLIEQAIDSLRDTATLNVEAHSLLAILFQEKIKFAPDETFELVTQVRNQISSAIELDSENLRAQLANVMNSVIEIPGFGRSVDPEETIALALEKASLDSADIYSQSTFAHAPTWGLARILGFEVIYHMNIGNTEHAVEAITRALEEFPDHYWLMELAARIE
ncbi:MAG: hypothetical protein OXG08_07585 [Gammaproteobacteria bacterium]|nr:hypothetical protein [Gammaproteobacteria bacterium]